MHLRLARRRRTRALLLGAWLLPLFISLAVAARPAAANGGTLQVSGRRAGPYELTVFTSPSPIQVGVVDVSVLVQRPGSTEALQNARVTVTAEPVGREGQAGSFEATHERATNKLFYAADVRLDAPGRWRIGVEVVGDLGVGHLDFEVEAAEPSPLSAPLLILLVAVPLVLLLTWRLYGRAVRRSV